MYKINELSNQILKDGKMTSNQIIELLAHEIEIEDYHENSFINLYKKAYGEKFNKSIAESWVHSMAVTDGSGETDGEKWTCEEAIDIGNSSKIAIDWNSICKTDWYICLNLMYSDYFKTAKSIGLQDDSVFFARLAKEFLQDEDAIDSKLFEYWIHIAK